MARAAVEMPLPAPERTWAGIEGMLDRLADDIRQATAALTARCAQVIADTGELTARQAWHLLIAIGADAEALDGWREQPQGRARLLTGYLSQPRAGQPRGQARRDRPEHGHRRRTWEDSTN
jgi:hypothetical protein